MKAVKVVIGTLLVMLVLAAPASADLSRWDPNDVSMRLDLRRVTSTVYEDFDAIGLTIKLYRSAPDVDWTIIAFYDAFGSGRADFALGVRRRDGFVGCRLRRLSDGRLLDFGDADEPPPWRYYYCEVHSPPRMREHSGIHWRVVAVVPGVGRDLAPNKGWYPHI